MSRFKCIIFDCDGVLVDSEPIGNKVMVTMANELGAEVTLEYAYKHFKGHSIKTCIARIAKLVTKPMPSNFEVEYRRRSFEQFKAEIKPIAGVEEVIKSLNVPYCVASSGPEHKIKLNLELTDLWSYFEGKIFSCYTINKWKPEPDVFLWAAETMGFSPEDCVVIEDSITGVQAANSGGFDVFAYTAHDCNNELYTLATKTFKNMSDLPELLKN